MSNRLCCAVARSDDLAWYQNRSQWRAAKWSDPMDHITLVKKMIFLKKLGTPMSDEVIEDIKFLQSGPHFNYIIGYDFLGEYPDEYWMILK